VTPPAYTPSRAFAELAVQHAGLRDAMDRCEALADALDAGGGDPAELLREVVRLRTTFDAHNRFEEQLLRPVLLDADGLGAVRVSRMVDDHVAEHRAMGRQLASVATPTSELRAVVASLRAHLAAEEHHFLASQRLRGERSGE
jgi:iron-sulfur cluster repair protein YtfE (RIC family)